MAATVAPLKTSIDLKTQASYPLRLGASVLQSPGPQKYASVRYNHKPRLQSPKDARYKLQSVDGDEEALVLRDGKDEYKYTGKSSSNEDWYVLVSKGSGKDAETVLERLGTCHDFNLVQTPLEKDAAELATQFQHLPIDDEEGLFGDEGRDDEPPVDRNNPYDYRNYLKSTATTSKSHTTIAKEQASTPVSAPVRAANSTPTSRPSKKPQDHLITQKKRKAQAPPKVDPKRVKAGTEPPRQATANSAKPAQDVPKVRIDRKASVRRPSNDDSGELILENETPVSEKPPKRAGAMALALAGQLGPGPISLRSAASSPASMMPSPMPDRPEGMDEGEEFEFGGSESSPEAASKRPLKLQEDDYFGGGEDEDHAEDADVEDLELPSPAQTHRKSVSAAGTGITDDDDDLDKQLALAMAEDDDPLPPPAAPAESDEESEEE